MLCASLAKDHVLEKSILPSTQVLVLGSHFLTLPNVLKGSSVLLLLEAINFQSVEALLRLICQEELRCVSFQSFAPGKDLDALEVLLEDLPRDLQVRPPKYLIQSLSLNVLAFHLPECPYLAMFIGCFHLNLQILCQDPFLLQKSPHRSKRLQDQIWLPVIHDEHLVFQR